MIVVLDNIGSNASDILLNSPYKVSFDPADLPFAVCIIVRNTKLPKEMIQQAPKLKAIARAGVGTDTIDTDYATSQGILIFNADGGNSVNAAETTIGLLLSLAHKITYAHTLLHHQKIWERGLPTEGFELEGKHIGIIGCGNIGSLVAKFACSFNMNVHIYDPYISEFPKHTVQETSLQEMLPKCDIVTLHVPLTKETTYMINKETITYMKNGSYVINVSRGKVVSEKALIDALRSKKIAGAALDVFEQEPLADDSALFEFENIITIPHLGGASVEARNRVAEIAVKKILTFLEQ